jgi:hypothetical protein
MRHAEPIRIWAGRFAGENLLFSVAFVSAVVAVTSILCAIDVATVRALLSLP